MTQPQCREQLIKEDVVWVLIKLAASEDSNDSTRIVCARAICSLSFNAKGCNKLLEHKAIPAVYMLCRDGDEKTKRYAAITLLNLSAAKDSHAIVSLTTVLCSAALSSYLVDAAHLQMLSHGAIGCLVELADCADEETRLHCVGALCNLSASLACRTALVEQHAADALNLAKCKNKVLCSFATACYCVSLHVILAVVDRAHHLNSSFCWLHLPLGPGLGESRCGIRSGGFKTVSSLMPLMTCIV